MRRMCAPILAACLLASPAPQAAGAQPGLVVVAPGCLGRRPAAVRGGRAREGLAVAVLALEELAGAPGADAPERIKGALYSAWRERGARYVLLAGDAGVVPVRFMTLDRATAAAHDTAFYASDLYYADVADAAGAFEDWNARTDGHHAGYFGEVHGETHKRDAIDQDGVDYLPELAVGRWPVSTEEELRAVIAKTLAYGAGAPSRASSPCTPTGGSMRARSSDGSAIDLAARASRSSASSTARRTASRPRPACARRCSRARARAARRARVRRELAPVPLAKRTAKRWPRPRALGLPLGRLQHGAPLHRAALPGLRRRLRREHRGTNDGEVFADPPPPAPLQPGPLRLHRPGERLLRSPTGGAVVYMAAAQARSPARSRCSRASPRPSPPRPTRASATPGTAPCATTTRASGLSELVPTDSWYPPSVFFQGMKFLFLGDPTLRLTPER
jgi:hypothetical protein